MWGAELFRFHGGERDANLSLGWGAGVEIPGRSEEFGEM